MCKIALALLSTIVLLGVPPSQASESNNEQAGDKDKSEASRRFQRALELVDDGQMAEALIEFQRSYELKPHFQVLYNIAQAHIALAQPVEAAEAFERYLADGGSQISKARRKEVEAELARQRTRIATVNVRVAPVEARLQVDGRDRGPVSPATAVAVRVGVGNHKLRASADGYLPSEAQIAVAGEDLRDVELVLEKVPSLELAPAPSPIPPVPPLAPVVTAVAPLSEPAPAEAAAAPSSSRNRAFRNASYAVAATGLVALASSALLWLRATGKHDDAQAKCDGLVECPDEAVRLQSQAVTAANWSNVTGVTGVVLLGAGAALYFLFPPDSPRQHALIVPFLQQQAAGLAAKGAF